MKQIILLCLFSIYTTFAFGQNLVTYDFTSEPGNQASTNPNSTAINVLSNPIIRGSGVAAAAGANSISSSGWATGAINLSDYYEITLEPNIGYKLDLDNLQFQERRSTTGIANFEVRTSLDGYSASYFSTAVPDNDLTRTHDFSFPAAFDNVTTAITIRIYGYNAEAGTGTWRIGNYLRVVGAVISTAPADIQLIFDDNGQPNFAKGSDDNVFFRVRANVTTANATLNQVSITTNGTYSNTDIKASGFKLWYSTDNIFNTGDTQIGTASSVSGNGETITFTGLSQSMPTSGFNFLFITSDITTSATLNNTIGVINATVTDFVFAAPSNKTGSANNGNLHTIIGLNTGTVATEFCVTATESENIVIPFDYFPSSVYNSSTFTAQLSDASGSFLIPTVIGSVASDGTGSQSILGTIPAATPNGTGYRVRVVSTNPDIDGADNGTDITINLLLVTISPTVTQNIFEFQNGDTVTATESHPIISRRWKYSTASGGPYTEFLGSDPAEIPYFETAGTYYLVCETEFDCGKSAISNQVQINVANFEGTRLFPGDIILVGWDAAIGGTSTDQYAITNLIPLKKGTRFIVANITYENGSTANSRTNQWQGGRDYIEFTYNGASDLAAGSIISFEFNNVTGATAQYIRINNVAAGATITSTVGFASARPNLSTTGIDQIFIMQGNFDATGADFDGYVLFGMTNGSDWIILNDDVTTPRTSRAHPNILCLNTEHPTIQGASYFNLAALHTGSQREILASVINMSNWIDGTTIPAAVQSTTFNVTSSVTNEEWIGDVDQNWFDCRNWSDYYVPDRRRDVLMTTSALDNSRINESADFSDEYGDIAETRNITIENQVLIMSDNRNSKLSIYQDLTIQGTGIVRMDDDIDFVPDGTINIYGQWNNKRGDFAFEEGRSLVVFEGGNAQNITSTDTETFALLHINSGKDVTIDQEIFIIDTLQFFSGNIQSATTRPVTFLENSDHLGADATKHIRGAARRISNKVEDFIFPIGKSGIYRPLTIHTQSGGAITQFFAEYFYAGYGTYQPVVSPLDHVSQIEHWILNRESGTSNAQLTLSWGAESIVGNLGSLVVAHWTTANQWESRGNSLTTGNTIAGTVKSSDIITQFSPFTLGTIDNTNLLPVTWLSFDVKYNQEQKNVLLEWKTLSEHQNQSFVIERSKNGIDFTEIGIKNGNLDSRSIKNYQFWDFELLYCKTYYRIKQIDTDGNFSYSNVKMIESKIESEKDKKLGITNYQNKTIFYSNLNQATKARVRIYDMTGNTVGVFEVFLKEGQNELVLPFHNISKAVYVYKIELENQSNFVSGKFLIK